jgi:hypothetical protein
MEMGQGQAAFRQFLIPPSTPLFAPNLKFRNTFSEFFFLEYELRKMFSEIFSEFEIEKFRKTHSELFYQGQNWNIGELKRGVGRETFLPTIYYSEPCPYNLILLHANSHLTKSQSL